MSPPARARSSSPCRRGSSRRASPSACAALAARRARPRLSRRRVRLSRRRAPPARRARRARRADARAARRHQRRALPPPRPQPLADVLTCIRENCTIAEAGFRLEANAERHLKSRREMARLFARLSRSASPARSRSPSASRFTLDELRYEYPDEPVPPGKTPQAYLEELTWAARRPALSRRRAGQGARAARQGAGADRAARLRALFPDRPRHRALRPRARTSCARAAARPPTPRSASASASPRRSRPRSTCCSSASSPPSAASRPTSTSTSSTSGARR